MSTLFKQIDLTVPGGDNVKQGFTKINNNMTLLETWLKLGSGSPENVVSGYVGAVYLDITNGTLYQKVTGSNTKTGWQSIAGIMLSSAQHFATPKTIAVSGNTLTLTEDSNIFVVSGTSTISSITGWTQGIAFIRWTQARTLTHNATSLILQNGKDRSIKAGDISIFEMTTAGTRELNYFPSDGYYNFEKYGLDLSHSSGDITVAAGQRYADDHSTQLVYAGGTLTVGTLVAGTRYYIFLGKDESGTVVVEKDTSATGDNLSTITGAKCIIGEFYAQAASTSIDTTILVTYHADGSKTYVYQQATGVFPSNTVTITHNFGTTNINVQLLAIDSSGNGHKIGTLNATSTYMITDPWEHINSNSISIIQDDVSFYTFDNTYTSLKGSSNYKLKVRIKTEPA